MVDDRGEWQTRGARAILAGALGALLTTCLAGPLEPSAGLLGTTLGVTLGGACLGFIWPGARRSPVLETELSAAPSGAGPIRAGRPAYLRRRERALRWTQGGGLCFYLAGLVRVVGREGGPGHPLGLQVLLLAYALMPAFYLIYRAAFAALADRSPAPVRVPTLRRPGNPVLLVERAVGFWPWGGLILALVFPPFGLCCLLVVCLPLIPLAVLSVGDTPLLWYLLGLWSLAGLAWLGRARVHEWLELDGVSLKIIRHRLWNGYELTEPLDLKGSARAVAVVESGSWRKNWQTAVVSAGGSVVEIGPVQTDLATARALALELGKRTLLPVYVLPGMNVRSLEVGLRVRSWESVLPDPWPYQAWPGAAPEPQPPIA